MKKNILLILVFSFLSTAVFAQKVQNNFILEGIKMHDKGDYEGAIEMYKKALASNPKSVQAKYEMASSYLQLKAYANTIKYSDMVIAANLDYLDQAYILKGSALDYSGKPGEAVKIYKQALKKFNTNQLLYYNLALTSFSLQDYKQTDEALLKALRLDPFHASSHFLLGLSMLTQGKRIQGILAMYNFLLLEPKSKRSVSALQELENAWKKSSTKEKEKPAPENPPVKKEVDEFYTASLMLDILESSKNNEANKNKPAVVLFAESTNTLFTILGDAKKDKKGFWWNFYVDYFYTLSANHHTEALCYYITQSKDKAYEEWIKDNLPKMQAFSEWYTKYQHKY